MDPTASIRKLGFRRWYERQLIGSHLALVTCLLCGIVVAALMEEISFHNFGGRQVSLLAVDFGAIVLGWFSWKQYITMLTRAERYGQCSNCPKCDAYGRFKVIDTGMDRVPGPAALAVAPLDSAWMRVECRQCGTLWTMPE
jgi:hypothetical protein